MVAAATSNLCEAANASVQGHASEEKLISSAKQVAASTAQLLVACKVKADHDSEAMRRLQVLVFLITENPLVVLCKHCFSTPRLYMCSTISPSASMDCGQSSFVSGIKR